MRPKLLLSLASVLLGSSVVGQVPSPMDDQEIRAAFDEGCGRGHPIERYRGVAGRFDDVGPLWLAEPREERARGVILPPFLRLYHLGRSRGCGNFDVEEARQLAGPETWVVLWRSEDPPSVAGSHRTTSDQRVLRPTEVRLRSDGAWHQALWTRDRDPFLRVWFSRDWDERESLVAGFAELDRKGSLHVDYSVEEDGRAYLTDSAVFSLVTVPEQWWAAAGGGE